MNTHPSSDADEPLIDIWTDGKGGQIDLSRYTGMWVAIKNGEVIASAKTTREIFPLIDRTEEGAPMLHYVRPPGAFIG